MRKKLALNNQLTQRFHACANSLLLLQRLGVQRCQINRSLAFVAGVIGQQQFVAAQDHASVAVVSGAGQHQQRFKLAIGRERDNIGARFPFGQI